MGPLPKGTRLARARRELAGCLRDYPGVCRDRAKLRAAISRWQRIEKLAIDLYAMLAEEWGQERWSYNPLIDDASGDTSQPWIEVITETFAMQMHLRKGKLDPGRDWLYLSLLDILDQPIPRRAESIDQRHWRPLCALRTSCDGLGTFPRSSAARACGSPHRTCIGTRPSAWTVSLRPCRRGAAFMAQVGINQATKLMVVNPEPLGVRAMVGSARPPRSAEDVKP